MFGVIVIAVVVIGSIIDIVNIIVIVVFVWELALRWRRREVGWGNVMMGEFVQVASYSSFVGRCRHRYSCR